LLMRCGHLSDDMGGYAFGAICGGLAQADACIIKV
jgi:hypothetical protein